MASDPANNLAYYLSIAAEYKAYLGSIRHWNNLKIAFEEDVVWVKDLTPEQIDSIEIKGIPYKQLYYAHGPKLFLLGSSLPHCTIPALLWSPMERGLPIKLPSYNHNFFGVNQQVTIKLVPSTTEREGFALLTNIQHLQSYIETAAAIRLKNLHWVLLDENKALVTGLPQLPLQGEVLWRSDDFLLPAGYEFELFALTGILNERLNPGKDHWIVWNKEGNYSKVPKQIFQPLTISSFRISIKA